MKYEDQLYNAITRLGGKKQMNMNFLSKVFKLNKIRTKNVLCRTVNSNLTVHSLVDNLDLLKSRWRLIPALVQEKEKYKEFLKKEKLRLNEIKKKTVVEQKASKKASEIKMFNEPHENKRMPKIKLIGHFKQ